MSKANNKELYSGILDRRYAASVAGGRREIGNWPIGCGGAANAYLVLIGPSMGRVTRSGRPRPNRMFIGPDAMNFEWGDARSTRWLRLGAAILGDEDRAKALTALLNLTTGHATDARTIDPADLERGWQTQIWPLLRRVRPRIVCALTNAVWNVIAEDLPDVKSPSVECPVELARSPILFTIPNCRFTSILVKPHNHPSRFLSNNQIDTLGEGCAWLLRNV